MTFFTLFSIRVSRTILLHIISFYEYKRKKNKKICLKICKNVKIHNIYCIVTNLPIKIFFLYNNCFIHSANSLSFVLTIKLSDNSIICLILQCLNFTSLH